MTTLDIGSIVSVRATIAPSGTPREEFGRTLLLTADNALPVSARLRNFANLVEVAEVFPSDSEPYHAARVYFSQSPYPRNLLIGRWAESGSLSRLRGGTPLPLEQITGVPTVVRGTGVVASLDSFHGRATVLTGGSPASLETFHGRATVLTGTGTVADLVNFHGRATVVTGTGAVADLVNFHGRATVVTGTGTVASLTTLQGITSGSVTFLSQTVTGLDFSSDTDLDDVASTLQTALRATSSTDLDNVEVDYDSAASAFVVTLPLDSSGVVPTASAAFTGTESDDLGLDTATIVNGVDAIVSGTVTFLSQTLTGLDFSDVTDYDGVASTLQTALRGTTATSLDEVEVAYDESVFVVTIPLDSNGAATSVSAAFTGSESDELGLDTATIVDGVSAIQSGSVTFLTQALTGLDFSSVTDYDGVASVLQDALRAASVTALAAVEVAYQGGVFVVTIPLDNQGAATSVSAAFTGGESDDLGLDTATIVNGVDAITSGTVTFLSQTVTSLDFSAVTDYDGVATLLQTALRGTAAAALGSVEVVHDGSQFVVTVPLDSDGGATEVTGPFTGDNADELGLDSVEITPGVDGIGNASVVWQGRAISGLDFTGVASFGEIATILGTALLGVGTNDLNTASVSYDVSRRAFVVRLGFAVSDGAPYQITGHFEDVSQGAAAALGLDQSSGGVIAAGYADETVDEAMGAIKSLDANWYFLTVDSRIDKETDLMALAYWVQTQPHMLALDVGGPAVLAADETSSLAARLSALELERTFLVWSRQPDYKALSMAARLSGVNFGGPNTLITAKFKSLPGTVPDALDRAGQTELDRKRVNYYTRFGADAIFAEGWTLKPGTWIDVRYWLDWIVDEIKRRVFNLLYTQPTRLPQTDAGIASLRAEVERVCEAGVRNGGIAPGAVSEPMANDIRLATGNREFTGRLTKGFLVHVDPLSSLTEADRAARNAPGMKVWLKGSGAIHFADIELVFVN